MLVDEIKEIENKMNGVKKSMDERLKRLRKQSTY
jgi:predicted chitinase